MSHDVAAGRTTSPRTPACPHTRPRTTPHNGPVRRLRTLVPVLVGVLLLTGCWSGTDEGALARDRFAERLTGLDGVAEARVDRAAFDTDYWGERIVVDLVPGVREAEVRAVLDALVEHRLRSNGPQDVWVTIDAGTTDSPVDLFGADAPPMAVPGGDFAENATVANRLVTLVDRFPDAHVSVTPTDWTVVAAGPGTDPRPVMRHLLRGVRGDADLRGDQVVNLLAEAGHGETERSLQLSVEEGITPDLLRQWRHLAPHLEGPVFRTAWVTSEWIRLGLVTDPPVTPREFTTDRFGEPVWSLLRPSLRVFATMPTRAEFTAIHHWRLEPGTSPAAGGGLEDRFLDIRANRRPSDDRHGRTWNAEAGRYLRDLPATRD